MLPLLASLTFQTAPTVFPLVSSVADDPSDLPKTCRKQLHQAQLDGCSKKKKQQVTMGYPPSSQSIFRAAAGGENEERQQPPSPRFPRRSRPSEGDSSTTPREASSIPRLASWMDRMLCCGMQHQQFAQEEEEELVWRHPGAASKLSERALQSFPTLELARELRESTSRSNSSLSPTLHHQNQHRFRSGPIPLFEPATEDFADKDKTVRLLFPVVGPPPPPPPPSQPRKSTQGRGGRFVLDEQDRRQDSFEEDDDEDQKKSSFYKQVMTRSSTATTASMGRSASSISESSLQSWNTLPTQPSDLDEGEDDNDGASAASCASEPQPREGRSQNCGACPSAKLRLHHQHKRQSTDPSLAERFLVQQLQEKLTRHQHQVEESSTLAIQQGSSLRSSVYYHQNHLN
jgi:hypothetical protein